MIRQKVILPALAVLSVMSIASSVHAEAFTYYTTGVFASTGTNVVNGVPPGSNLTFTGVGTSGSPVGPIGTNAIIGLGAFTLNDLNGGANNLDSYAGQAFTLNIYQVAPVSGGSPPIGTGGVLSGVFSGVFEVDSGVPSGGLTILLSGQVIAPGSVPGSQIVYAPSPNPEGVSVAINKPGSVEGSVTAAPLPTSGLAGLALFGVFGAVKFRSQLFGMA